MSEKNDKKVLLSLKDVEVKFNVRGRILTAIRGVSLDIYENESIAIVGESGSGKSVLTKTFAGMLDSNGFIPNGKIIFSDDEISKTDVKLTDANRQILKNAKDMLNKHSVLERDAEEYLAIQKINDEIKLLSMKSSRKLKTQSSKRQTTSGPSIRRQMPPRSNPLMILSKI